MDNVEYASLVAMIQKSESGSGTGNSITDIAHGGTSKTTAKDAVEALEALYLNVGTLLPENANIDEYLTPGTFEVLNSVIPTLSGTVPFTGHSFKLIVCIVGRSYYKCQIALSPSVGQIRTRDYNSTTNQWNAWKIVNLPTTATASTAGLMSSSDKIKLDSITVTETGTWTPTTSDNTEITIIAARYYYNGKIIMLEANFEVGDNATDTFYLGGFPILPYKYSRIAGSGYVLNSSITVSVAVFGSTQRIAIHASESLAGKTVVIGLAYMI